MKAEQKSVFHTEFYQNKLTQENKRKTLLNLPPLWTKSCEANKPEKSKIMWFFESLVTLER